MVLCASHTKSLKKRWLFTPHIVIRWECRHLVCWQHVECGPTQNNEYSRYLALSMWGWIQASNDTLTSNPVILSMHLNVLYRPTVLRKMGRTNQRPTSCQEGEILSCIIHELHPFFRYRRIPRKLTKMSLWILNTIFSASTNNTWSRHYITVTQQRRKKLHKNFMPLLTHENAWKRMKTHV